MGDNKKRANVVEVNCDYCSKPKIISEKLYFRSKSKVFYCDRNCKHENQKGRSHSEETIRRMKNAQSGKNNSNYKHGHCLIKDVCKICGREKDWRSKVCNGCYTRQTFLGKHHNFESKVKIGIGSKEKFKKEGYLQKVRKVNEERGNWVPLLKSLSIKFIVN
jgi:hypothetical protein